MYFQFYYLNSSLLTAILSFGGRKKERSRPRFIPDSYISGAISWQVQVSCWSTFKFNMI